MYETQYGEEDENISMGQTLESIDARENLATVLKERTEELPEQRDDGETKKTFRERGGVPYINNASFIESQEFSVMSTTGGKRLVLKNQDSKVGLYSTDEDGKNKTIIQEDGTMPRVEEIYTILVDFMETVNTALSEINEKLEDLENSIEDIEDELSAPPTP